MTNLRTVGVLSSELTVEVDTDGDGYDDTPVGGLYLYTHLLADPDHPYGSNLAYGYDSVDSPAKKFTLVQQGTQIPGIVEDDYGGNYYNKEAFLTQRWDQPSVHYYDHAPSVTRRGPINTTLKVGSDMAVGDNNSYSGSVSTDLKTGIVNIDSIDLNMEADNPRLTTVYTYPSPWDVGVESTAKSEMTEHKQLGRFGQDGPYYDGDDIFYEQYTGKFEKDPETSDYTRGVINHHVEQEGSSL